MNNVDLVGRLTKDIELRTNQNGKNVVKFTVAVNRDKDHSDFINCIAWNKTAETMSKYCKKGDRLGITGYIQTGSYEKENGDKVYTTDVVVNKLYFLGTKSEQDNVNEEQDNPLGNFEDCQVLTDNDLPF